jgi:hypothetical protein
VNVSSDDFSMTAGSSQDVARAETPQVVASSLDSDKRMDPPRIPAPVQVHGEETIGVVTGGRDPGLRGERQNPAAAPPQRWRQSSIDWSVLRSV